MKRRNFIATTAGAAAGASLLSSPVGASITRQAKKKIAMVGTGVRGINFWGKRVVDNYGDIIEFVGLSDINPGRLELAKRHMNVKCPVFTDFDQMMKETKPETVIVTTMDSTHHEFIIKSMEYGADVISEKPMTTDEVKSQAILEAEKRTGKKCKFV